MAGVIAFFGLPNSLATAKFFTPEEREWAVKRLEGNEHDRFRYVIGKLTSFFWF